MEIEAKFALPNVATLQRLQTIDYLADLALSEGRTKQVQDTYLDTAERTILAARYACRQREQGDEGVLMTLKGLGGVQDAVHRREELETPMLFGALPVDWPDSPVRDRVLQLIGDAPLIPLFDLKQTRIVRQINQGERLVAELSLDDVHLAAGDREQAYFELEVELSPQGTEDELVAIVTCLQDDWDLEPEHLSKFERALAFLENAGSDDRLLTSRDRDLCQKIAVRDDLYGRRARALLALDEGATQVEAGKRAGRSDRTVRHWLVAFRQKRMNIFPARVLTEAVPAPTSPAPQVGESPEPWSLKMLFDRYSVDQTHARTVADHAMMLFDHLLPFHVLPPERRTLLEMAALLHNVGLQTDPDRHQIVGRDILLAHPPVELDEHERRIVALTTFLHRKRINRKKLDKLTQQPLFVDLPEPLQVEALALAALVRLADGLDYTQNGSSIAQVQQQDGTIEIEIVGPSSMVDAERAQVKSDLWQLLFAIDLYFKSPETMLRAIGSPVSTITKPPNKPGLKPDDSMAEAARKTFLFHFQRMLYHEPGTRLGEDIEALHDMRVATRRMRAALRVFGDYLDLEQMRPFIKGLRRTGRTLGAVRDLDVFWEKTQHYLDDLPLGHQLGLEPLRAVWKTQRDKAREQMLAYLDGNRYVRFRERFGEFLQTPNAGALSVLSEKDEPVPHRLRHVVPVAVYQRLAAVRAYDEWVTGPDVPLERLHQLRIVAKGLRYTVEYFREVLGADAKKVIGEVKKLQDHLGDLQDAVVASNLLRDFLTWGTWGHVQQAGKNMPFPTEPIVAPGVASYLATRQIELQRLLDTFPQVWSSFQGPEFGQWTAATLVTL
ncbi:MAG: CHAD domain-containing protein [Chloroflexi bacterium]|nr:CHAD domain-containing protein [Chloroflexota bacterium]